MATFQGATATFILGGEEHEFSREQFVRHFKGVLGEQAEKGIVPLIGPHQSLSITMYQSRYWMKRQVLRDRQAKKRGV